MALRDFTKEKFDIIIQAGQSNSNGRGEGAVDNPYTPCEDVWYLTPEYTIEMAREYVAGNVIRSNAALSFVRKYMEAGMLGEGRKILILRTAVDGTSFSEKRWTMDGDLYLRMMDMIRTALELNGENRLVAILWHQGENDVYFQMPVDAYYRNLSGLVHSVRDTFGVPALPFIAGDFVKQWKETYYISPEPILSTIRKVCADLDKAAFVGSDGLLSNDADITGGNGNGDTIHFCRSAFYEYGERYFEAFCELVK
ncbi:MAG: hypothetical protein IJ325_06180 [Clostridia bacterium]|nr:hypothetical protein [Clostridia bacterium]